MSPAYYHGPLLDSFNQNVISRIRPTAISIDFIPTTSFSKSEGFLEMGYYNDDSGMNASTPSVIVPKPALIQNQYYFGSDLKTRRRFLCPLGETIYEFLENGSADYDSVAVIYVTGA